VKIVVTARADGLDAPVDARFGRAARFVIYDTETRQTSSADNGQNLNAAQGAGIQAAESVSRLGAKCLITGHCGPKAFRTLSAAGIEIYTGATGTVRGAIEAFEKGLLTKASTADVDGHW
jgi:predicted Fe-Mo cluster-binding NifX family protein